MVINRNRQTNILTIIQSAYLNKVITKFSMKEAKHVNVPLAAHMSLSLSQSPKTEFEMKAMKNIPYANDIGSVVFSVITTRLDFAYAISVFSRFMFNPGKSHWARLKWLLIYIARTLNMVLMFEKRSKQLTLKGHVDSDFVGDKDQRKSTVAYFFTLGDSCIK